MKRRNFLNFAGITALASTAVAQTWRKITVGSGSANTWRKAQIVAPTSGYRYVAMHCGEDHVLALKANGVVFACGRNNYGQLGDNTTTNRSSFVQCAGLSNIVAVSGGTGFSLVLRADGAVFAAGKNIYGELGDNTTVNRSSFVQAVGVSNIKAIAAGQNHSAILRNNGDVFAVGGNQGGQLGINTQGYNAGFYRSSFVQCTGISNGVLLAAPTSGHTLVLRNDGLVFGCGYNGWPVLGDGTTEGRSTFVQAVGISNAVALGAGANTHSAAIRSDGLVFSVGAAFNGRLGNNDGGTHRSTYIQSTGISNAVSLALGNAFSVALRGDGLLFGTGDDNNGQLGGPPQWNQTFFQLANISNVVQISASSPGSGSTQFTYALRADGVLFATGTNANGELGNGTITNRSSWTQVLGQ
jgi:alpha-tubulin suppressor-like RCC1 family protein